MGGGEERSLGQEQSKARDKGQEPRTRSTPLHDSQSQDGILATTSPAPSPPTSDASFDRFFNEVVEEPPGLYNAYTDLVEGQNPASGLNNHYCFFNEVPWETVTHWQGTTLTTILIKCRTEFRDLGNSVFDSASAGIIPAIKAAQLFARLILFKPAGLRGNQTSSLVRKRLSLWSQKEFATLWSELLIHNQISESKQRPSNPPDPEKNRNSRVIRHVRVGELSKGIQAAMPSQPFGGSIQELQDLHPPKTSNLHLPISSMEFPAPTVSPTAFYHAICKTHRGTAQTANGWHSDLLKDINVAPSDVDDDPLYGFRAFSLHFAAGTLPVPQLVYSHLSSATHRPCKARLRKTTPYRNNGSLPPNWHDRPTKSLHHETS